MTLKSHAFRVAPEWLTHLQTQVEACAKLLPGKQSTSMVVGAAIMGFNPASNKEDRARLASFIDEFNARKQLFNSDKLSDKDRKDLERLLAKARG